MTQEQLVRALKARRAIWMHANKLRMGWTYQTTVQEREKAREAFWLYHHLSKLILSMLSRQHLGWTQRS